MVDSDYPALYQAADQASILAQSTYLCILKWHIFLLVLGAAFFLIPAPSKVLSLINAAIFLGALGLSILIAIKKYEKTWYSARAVAESVKTATWRYMMKADPFLDAESRKQVNSVFYQRLNSILSSNNQLGESLGGPVSALDQLSMRMEEIRSLPLGERRAIYLAERIDEQRKWYADKSGDNRFNGKMFFALLVVLHVIAIALVLSRIAFPEWEVWPTDIFVVMAGGVMTWMQVKRFGEIATAYALTAHEIGMVRMQIENSDTDKEFSEFVKDAENAFSREHTQWVARQGA